MVARRDSAVGEQDPDGAKKTTKAAGGGPAKRSAGAAGKAAGVAASEMAATAKKAAAVKRAASARKAAAPSRKVAAATKKAAAAKKVAASKKAAASKTAAAASRKVAAPSGEAAAIGKKAPAPSKKVAAASRKAAAATKKVAASKKAAAPKKAAKKSTPAKAVAGKAASASGTPVKSTAKKTSASGTPAKATATKTSASSAPAKATARKPTPATPTPAKKSAPAKKAAPAAVTPAKPTPAKATPSKATPSKAAPAKAAPAKAASAKATPSKAAPTKITPAKPPRNESHTALVRRARRINRELGEVYPYAHPELDFENPFQLVVATVLSAQTTDLRVNQTTPALFGKYPTPEDLAAANPEEVEEILRPTGFFRAKTKSVIGLSKALRDDFGGEVPGRLEDLVKLPGVGRKTAFVVLGNAFGRPGITVDTHFQRLVRRWQWTDQTEPDKIEAAIGGLFPKSEWTMLSHHVIFHGRRICHARKPACGACPIAPLCPAYGEGETDPEKAQKLLKYEKGGFPGQRLNPPQSYLDAGGIPAPPLGAPAPGAVVPGASAPGAPVPASAGPAPGSPAGKAG